MTRAVRSPDSSPRNTSDRSLVDVFGPSPHPSVLLDRSGVIARSNAAWRSFGPDAGAPAAGRVGTDYVAACRRAARSGDVNAVAVLAALKDILAGGRARSTVEYESPMPTGMRWYRCEIIRHRGLGLVSVRHVRLTGPTAAEATGGATIGRESNAVADLLARADRRWAVMFAGSPTGMAVEDERGRYVAVNPALSGLFGRPEAELLGRLSPEFISTALPPGDFGRVEPGARAGLRPVAGRIDRPDGHSRWVHVTTHPVPGPMGREWTVTHVQDVTGYRSIAGDHAGQATSHAAALSELRSLALTDALTGLPNRRNWNVRLGIMLNEAAVTGRPVTIGLVDINKFKKFNDANGHQAGDALLRAFADEASQTLRADDVFARWGGDEFAIGLPNCPATRAPRILDRVRRVLTRPETCSIGWSTWNFADTADEVTDRADRALYSAKAAGGSRLFPSAGRPDPSVPAGASAA